MPSTSDRAKADRRWQHVEIGVPEEHGPFLVKEVVGEGKHAVAAAKEEAMLFPGSSLALYDGVLPETLEEAEMLTTSIERAVQRETGRAIHDLTVEVTAQGVVLKGHCHTYHSKQLAQHAAMATSAGSPLTNCIEVS